MTYIRCIHCGQEFQGNNFKTVITEWDAHNLDCEAIRETDDWFRIRRQILSRDKFQCQRCDSNKKLEVHHIKPISQGGNHNPANLITLCKDCHIPETMQLLKHIRIVKIKNMEGK